MKVLIIGGDATGAQLASILVAEKHEVCLIEHRREVLAHLHLELPTEVIYEENATDLNALEGAGIRNVDVVVACTSNDAVLDAAIAERKKSVARINFIDGGGSYACSGTLINSGQFPAPFFLTANHCISTIAAAASITSLWFYEAASCGSAASGVQQQVAGGAQLVFTS